MIHKIEFSQLSILVQTKLNVAMKIIAFTLPRYFRNEMVQRLCDPQI